MSKDINVTDGTVLETLNNKVDLDGGNYKGSPLEEYIHEHCGGSGLQLFDTILKDHVLTYEESKGLALQGTYVYKEAVAGSRYGYPDFYAKCLEEKEASTATEVTLGDNTITMYVASNGHQFYDIANKDVVDTFFGAMGTAWFYGVDTENERIFLPRNNYFEQATGDISEVGQSVEAGLPNLTGYLNTWCDTLKGASSAFSIKSSVGSAAGWKNSLNNTSKPYEQLVLNASNSNPIYGNSNTVQPNSVKKLLYICVGNTTNFEGMTDVVNQGMEILEQVNEGISTRADGQWTFKRQTLSTATALGNYTYDLSDYLPNDGYDYEVQFECAGYIAHNSTNPGALWIGTQSGTPAETSCEIVMAHSGWSVGHCSLKISNRMFYGRLSNSQMANVNFYAVSYRRLGTNQ